MVGFAAGYVKCEPIRLQKSGFMDLSIVIPVRNEADNIAPLVAEITEAMTGLTQLRDHLRR